MVTLVPACPRHPLTNPAPHAPLDAHEGLLPRGTKPDKKVILNRGSTSVLFGCAPVLKEGRDMPELVVVHYPV